MRHVLCVALITGFILLAGYPVGAQAGDWKMTNYDPAYSRNSPQTDIGKDNVASLQVKWILNTGYAVENPPLIVGNTVYAQNNAHQVIAIDPFRRTVTLNLINGFSFGKPVLYISTESSDPTVSAIEANTFAPRSTNRNHTTVLPVCSSIFCHSPTTEGPWAATD